MNTDKRYCQSTAIEGVGGESIALNMNQEVIHFDQAAENTPSRGP